MNEAGSNDRKLRVFQFIEGGARYGAAVSVMNVAEGMRSRNVGVEFGVFQGKPLGDVLRERGLVVHEVPAKKRFDARGIAYLMRLFRSQRFDVVHTHLSRATVTGSIAARLTRTPVVSTIHGMNRKYTYLLANHIITVSEAAKQHLVRQGVSSARVTAVYNGIPLEPFAQLPPKADARQAFGLAADAIVLGTVSRAHRQKGIDLAIDAVAELRRRGADVKYLFIGDGPHLAEFQAQAEALGITEHVKFPGFSDDIAGSLAAMDLFLFPTLREAFGISLLEAMACEVPVVASAVDGVPEVLDQESGILVQERSACAFADAAGSLLTDPAMRQRIVGNARRRVETTFSVEQTAKGVEHVYRQTIKAAKTGARNPYRNIL